ncbi:putative membrane protein [Flavobacteriaceae bacterium MAR_2010_72]|nr:putative membrane protein [Flavobacteriaceae bacterium MAR_2010_72]
MVLVSPIEFIKMTNPWHLYLMASLYVFAGIMHFIKPKLYLRIMPRYLPNHKLLVILSGLAEVILGIGLCFEATKLLAIYGIMAMLILFLLVHFYMLSSKKAGAGIPRWILILRIPLQFALMYWAYTYL